MENLINNHDFVRVWPDGSCTMLETQGRDKFDSIIVSKDDADNYYNAWAASDFGGTYFEYVQRDQSDMVTEGLGASAALTPEDQAIFAKLWMQGGTPPFVMIEGDHRDAEIMRVLAELVEVHGGPVTEDELNYIEQDNYVYWSGQCSPDYDFSPHYYT